MILSYARGFVFIKGRKVAGTSVEIALSALCGPKDILTPITHVDERYRMTLGLQAQNFARDKDSENEYLARVARNGSQKSKTRGGPSWTFYNHMPLREILREAPEARDFRRIMIERNPYAKVISQAAMLVGIEDYRKTGEMRVEIEDARRKASEMIEDRSIKIVRNISLYRDDDREVKGTVLRYEHLEDDFAELMRTLDVSEPPPLGHTKKSVLSNSIEPRDFFTHGQLRRINRMFDVEFERFGYAKMQ